MKDFKEFLIKNNSEYQEKEKIEIWIEISCLINIFEMKKFELKRILLEKNIGHINVKNIQIYFVKIFEKK